MPDPSQPAKIHVRVNSGPMAVREALGQLKQNLAPLALDVEELGTIELVVAEAMNNICEHAYCNGDLSGPIELRCNQNPDGLHFNITDSGQPMPGGMTPFGLAQSVDVDIMDLPEGGFGWFLIQDLAKDVKYAREGDHNHLSMRVAVCMRPAA